MKNTHQRRIAARLDQLSPWIGKLWSGTQEDCFPRDVIATWRKTDGVPDPDQLIPGRTRLGHGPFAFDFQQWDGRTWRVTFERPGMKGWHGFDLSPGPDGTLLAHTIEADLDGRSLLLWHLLIAPVHDWAVEAMLDRIQEALLTGAAPQHTTRPMTLATRVAFFVLKKAARLI